MGISRCLLYKGFRNLLANLYNNPLFWSFLSWWRWPCIIINRPVSYTIVKQCPHQNFIKIFYYAIKLVKGKQLLYGPIYSFSPIDIETLKAHIGTYLEMEFIILSFKSPTSIIILFNKLNNILKLYIDYQGLNNFNIKNWYSFLRIREFLNW